MVTARLPALALLYAQQREAIEGVTRFQKLIFLAQEETGVPRQYSYRADKYGPFSPTLHSDLDELLAEGLVDRNTVRNRVGHQKEVYTITTAGIRLVRSLAADDSLQPVFDAFEQTKRRYNGRQLGELLQYVYRSYPAYATESELQMDRLFDPEARSQFLDSDSEDTGYTGSKPGEFETVNPSAGELFGTSNSD